MTRDEFEKLLIEFSNAAAGSWRMNTMAQYNKTKEEILAWFDWAQPLIEFGLATQQAQEQAQQD
jgi:hypothetical protein